MNHETKRHPASKKVSCSHNYSLGLEPNLLYADDKVFLQLGLLSQYISVKQLYSTQYRRRTTQRETQNI